MSEFGYLPPPAVLVPPSGLVPLAQQQLPLPVPQSLAVPSLLVPGATPTTTTPSHDAPPTLRLESTSKAAEARSGSVARAEGPAAEQAVAQAPPDYRAFVYPALRDVLPYNTMRVGSLGVLQQPVALAAPHEVAVSAELMATFPRPPPPDFVVFGGARYRATPAGARGGRSLTAPGQREAGGARRDKVCARRGRPVEQDRLLFMSAQLQVARNFLKLAALSTHDIASPSTPPAAHRGNDNDANTGEQASAADDESGNARGGDDDQAETKDAMKGSLCSLAYWGTPQQLQTALDRPEMARAVDAVGTVCYRGREWALKRSGEHYTLGFGQRATPLQYAAAAGRTDNVFVLLRAGARDDERPHLRDMLSQALYKAIAPLLHHGAASPATRPRSRGAPPAMTTEDKTQSASI